MLQEKVDGIEDCFSLGLRSILRKQIMIIQKEIFLKKTTYDKFGKLIPWSAVDCEFLAHIAYSNVAECDSDRDFRELNELTDEESDSDDIFENS